MTQTKTLSDYLGLHQDSVTLANANLVIVDVQNEYFSGELALPEAQTSLVVIQDLLQRARQAGTPVFHVRHLGLDGSIFDPQGPRSAIVDALTPLSNEPVFSKQLPNSFTAEGFAEALKASGRPYLIVVGYMTHMCISATVRSALDHGFLSVVPADATDTRDLPDPLSGEVLPAKEIKRQALTALHDLYARVIPSASSL
ncbi:cysteine hydrolase family protein [Nitrincola tapanii]|uniref:Cysteine hydrolase n=1 Tax=Nitrincola tapanii TaxID=1708751 RepID=A0A5A9WAU7_9GAMM|nr:cysteine hydrolase family protein [Nitrincola tapanii]KAA0876561.1 cysteine hydrolase [Nitrincola tapanii]